jgi:large subunit ribosomal protein L29
MMKKNKTTVATKSNKNEQNSQVAKLKEEIFNLKLQKRTTSVEKTHVFKENRKQIARILTQINSAKKIGE